MHFSQLFTPGRLMLAAIIILTVYLLVSAGTNIVRSQRLHAEEDRLHAEIADLETQKQQLAQIRDYLYTDEYVEFVARRVFGLVKPGEKLVVVDSPPPEGQPFEQGLLNWWQRLFGREGE